MTDSLKVGLAQLNPKVGDVAGNLAEVRAARAEAARQGADPMVNPALRRQSREAVDRRMRQAAAVSVAIVLCACATQPELHIPKDAPLLFQAKVEGVQVYRCEGVDPNQWSYKATEARLFSEQALQLGVHEFRLAIVSSKGTWAMNDGSFVGGDIIAKQAAPATKAAPWLLVAVREHRGTGTLAGVESIRQIATKGGEPAVLGCTQMGNELRVPFSALHQFYGPGSPE